MSDPFTREKCGICGEEFEIPMIKDRRRVWIRQDASLSLNYCDDEEFSETQVCPECFQVIQIAVNESVETLKKGRGPDDRRKDRDVRQS
jgi:hypothetical protein